MASKRKNIDTESSPDKSELILTKPLNSCGKCSKKCLSKGEYIQYDLSGTRAHVICDNITHDQYKAITSLSSFNNLVYYCHSHDCINHVKNIISEWIKTNGMSEIKEVVTSLTQQYLSSEHSTLQKAVSDLSSRIDKLQAQELELTNEIKNTSIALEAHPDSIRSQNSNRKCNIVIFGMEESPPKTPKSTRLQKDTSIMVEIFSSLGVHVESSHISLTVFVWENLKYSNENLGSFWLNFIVLSIILLFLQTKLLCYLLFSSSRTCHQQS